MKTSISDELTVYKMTIMRGFILVSVIGGLHIVQGSELICMTKVIECIIVSLVKTVTYPVLLDLAFCVAPWYNFPTI